MEKSAKNLLFILLITFGLVSSTFAQAPEGIIYQAEARNDNGIPIRNQTLDVLIKIIQDNTSGSVVWEGLHEVTTSNFGIFALVIGHGTNISGYVFEDINWANHTHFLNVQVKTKNTPTWINMGTTQLLSVPYALHAKTAESITGNIIETDPVYAGSQAANITVLDITNLGNLSGVNTGDQDLSGLATTTDVTTGLDTKVDKVTGKGLSTNDYTTTDKDKLAGIATGAEVNVNADWNAITGDAQILNKPNIKGSAGATYRWTTFSTYHHGVGWSCGNDASLFGGVRPSDWTNGRARAVDLSADKEVLRSLFIRKGYAGSNAMIIDESFLNKSYAHIGKVVIVIFRIKNNTSSDIAWVPYFYYTAFSGWSEMASVAVNGVEAWHATESGRTNISLIIPAERISSVIFVSTSGIPDSDSGMRNYRLAFYNNSLSLPLGLEFIDDLDTAQGGWEQ